MPFRVDAYTTLLAGLRESGFRLVTVAEFLRAANSRDAFLRHDVDRFSSLAVQLAEREAAMGVRASYYFRCDSRGRFPAEACRRIAACGHEVGYHYEDLSRCGGELTAARESFRRHLAAFRELAPCTTVSMHGSPFSRHDNRRLLDETFLAEQKLAGDASNGLSKRHFLYFTDAGGKWNEPRVNRRDRMGTMPLGANPLDQLTLQALIQEHPGMPLGFNVHPERWTVGFSQSMRAAVIDGSAAAAKMALRLARK